MNNLIMIIGSVGIIVSIFLSAMNWIKLNGLGIGLILSCLVILGGYFI